jgi:hypothetical protein
MARKADEKAERFRAGSRLALAIATHDCNELGLVPCGHAQMLELRIVATYALSLEQGIKALAFFEAGGLLRGGDLKTLLRRLSPELQSRIVADTRDPKKRFETNLDVLRKLAKEWRDSPDYEGHLVEADLGFLQRFASAVQKALPTPREPPRRRLRAGTRTG